MWYSILCVSLCGSVVATTPENTTGEVIKKIGEGLASDSKLFAGSIACASTGLAALSWYKNAWQAMHTPVKTTAVSGIAFGTLFATVISLLRTANTYPELVNGFIHNHYYAVLSCAASGLTAGTFFLYRWLQKKREKERTQSLIKQLEVWQAKNNQKYGAAQGLQIRLDEIAESVYDHTTERYLRKSDKNIILSLACRIGDLDGVYHLLSDSDVDINYYDLLDAELKLMATPLLSAIYYGHNQIVHALLEKGADRELEVQHDPDYISVKSITQPYIFFTPLMLAIACGKTDLVDLLIKKGAEVNAVIPVYDVKTSAEEYQFSEEIHLEQVDTWTPLKVAVFHENQQIVEALLKERASIDFELMKSPILHDIISKFNRRREEDRDKMIQIMQMLINYGVDINQAIKPTHNKSVEGMFEIGDTALHVAAQIQGDIKTVQFLLKNNIDANKRNIFGQTALHKAAQKGNYELLPILCHFTERLSLFDKNRNRAVDLLPKDASHLYREILTGERRDLIDKAYKKYMKYLQSDE